MPFILSQAIYIGHNVLDTVQNLDFAGPAFHQFSVTAVKPKFCNFSEPTVVGCLADR